MKVSVTRRWFKIEENSFFSLLFYCLWSHFQFYSNEVFPRLRLLRNKAALTSELSQVSHQVILSVAYNKPAKVDHKCFYSQLK